MKFFFDIRKNRIAYSRIGRICISSEGKKHVDTPNIILPLTKSLLANLNFLEEFEEHEVFIISEESLLNRQILKRKFKNGTIIYYHYGTIVTFTKILKNHYPLFLEKRVFPIIPFNLPSTSISKKFTQIEIENYLSLAKKILEENPDINFGLTIRIFESKDVIDRYLPIIKEFKRNVKAVFLFDLFNNLHNFRNILDNIVILKKKLDNNLVLIASGKVLPIYLPTLIYIGIDLIDVSYLSYLSAENLYNNIEKLIPINKIKKLPCYCNICRGRLRTHISESNSFNKLDLLYLHNLISIKAYMNKIKYYLNYEDFRNFVEISSASDLNLLSILRILDRDYYSVLKYETPLFQKKKEVNCIGISSQNRPDFEEFRNRVQRRFDSEPWSKIVILLPCSSKKPYSSSKTHRKFGDVIRKFSIFPFFQEIILTSPLGAIPRQLENIYPVNSYDISVTGDWSEEELQITTDMLVELLKKYDENIPIICHIDGQYKEICERAKNRVKHEFMYTQVKGKLTSKESLESFLILLKNVNLRIENQTKNYPNPIISKTWERKLHKISDYMFGLGSSTHLFRNRIKLKKSRRKTSFELFDTKTNERLGKFNRINGVLDISILAGERLLNNKNLQNYVTFNGDSISGNNIFRTGIVEFSDDLIPENNVLILNESKTKVLATGRLIQGYNFIKNSNHGKIIEIYEKM